MPFLSKMLGRPVRDASGVSVGKLSDVFALAGEDFPSVTGISMSADSGPITIPWRELASLDEGGPKLKVNKNDIVPYQPAENELSLTKRVLDRQIIDINGKRVVRVNDLRLVKVDGSYRLVGADISTRGLLRRLGLERAADRLASLVRHEFPEKYIAWDMVDPVESQPAGIKLKVQHRNLAKLHPADIADIVEGLDRQSGEALLHTLDDETMADTIQEFDVERQMSVLEGMNAERAADIVEMMDPDEAADLLSEMPKEKADDILRLMDREGAEDVRELLEYPEDTAGGLMTTEYVAIPVTLTAEQTIQRLRELSPDAEMIYYVYVVDSMEHLMGVISLRDLIVSPPEQAVEDFMIRDAVTVRPDTDKEEVAQILAKYNLLAVPVVDEDHRLQGFVTVDDAIEAVMPASWKRRMPRVFS
ncbi:MAG: CBS domain-containing protein [Chloroflexi bacterium]|nr:CBS domain-containing protein [Chloroflexota bacterium]